MDVVLSWRRTTGQSRSWSLIMLRESPWGSILSLMRSGSLSSTQSHRVKTTVSSMMVSVFFHILLITVITLFNHFTAQVFGRYGLHASWSPNHIIGYDCYLASPECSTIDWSQGEICCSAGTGFIRGIKGVYTVSVVKQPLLNTFLCLFAF